MLKIIIFIVVLIIVYFVICLAIAKDLKNM